MQLFNLFAKKPLQVPTPFAVTQGQIQIPNLETKIVYYPAQIVENQDALEYYSGMLKLQEWGGVEVVDRNETMKDSEYSRYILNLLVDLHQDLFSSVTTNAIVLKDSHYLEIDIYVQEDENLKHAVRFNDFNQLEKIGTCLCFKRETSDRVFDSRTLCVKNYERIYVDPNQYTVSSIAAIEFRIFKGHCQDKSVKVFC